MLTAAGDAAGGAVVSMMLYLLQAGSVDAEPDNA